LGAFSTIFAQDAPPVLGATEAAAVDCAEAIGAAASIAIKVKMDVINKLRIISIPPVFEMTTSRTGDVNRYSHISHFYE